MDRVGHDMMRRDDDGTAVELQQKRCVVFSAVAPPIVRDQGGEASVVAAYA